jgi:N-acetylglucosaminyl-diphospho-decaprenol L-rhamnosyltransferase
MSLPLSVDIVTSKRHVVTPSPGARRPSTMTSATLDLDVGVIYSGEQSFMLPLVKSLAGSADGLRLRLILVDNASPEGVASYADYCPRTKIVANAKSLGYAANLNRILAASDARYTLLLNTDMYFDVGEQCIAKMVKFMDDNRGCGVSICRIYHPDGSYGYPARRFPTWRAIAARRLGLARFFGGELRDHLYQDSDTKSSFDCDWISGCFMLVRRDAMGDVGRFDEGYAKYFEDVDMCLRMARAGWQVMFHGQTYCYHYEQRASRRALSRDAWCHARSYFRWLTKWGLSVPSRAANEPSSATPVPTAARSLRHDPSHASPGQPSKGATEARIARRPDGRR